jgi:hypothetical protein
MKTAKVLAVLAVVGLIVWYGTVSHKETVAQRAIVNEVRGLIQDCRTAGDKVTVTGKALVWDMRSDSRSGAHGMISSSRQAKSTDKPITVFMVMGERNEQVGTYSISHQPAYRQYMDVAVAVWPDKKPVGFHSVVSKEPRSSRPVQQTPEYGDPNEPIARWIDTLR